MPHDCCGEELKVGDKVHIEGTVKSLSSGTDHCNVTVETCEGMPPHGAKTAISLNTKQVKKCCEEECDDSDGTDSVG